MHYAANIKNTRTNDPYLDRRSGDDRREAYDLDYFLGGGSERRSGEERRRRGERRNGWARVSPWSSVNADDDRQTHCHINTTQEVK